MIKNILYFLVHLLGILLLIYSIYYLKTYYTTWTPETIIYLGKLWVYYIIADHIVDNYRGHRRVTNVNKAKK